MNRRRFLRVGGVTALAGVALRGGGLPARSEPQGRPGHSRIYKAIKLGMFQEEIPLEEKFAWLKKTGFDGVEISSPGGVDIEEAIAASRATGLPIHGAVNSVHWHTRLSDPDPEVRAKSLEALKTAIRETHQAGGSAVLLVPGQVNDPDEENHFQVWRRSIAEIRKALPLASRLGIHILIENVWNGFGYDPDGPDDQTASLLAAYIDEIDSPWVGSYFDIGNHQRFGPPPEWIRQLGRRIVKLDVKDWGKESGFSKIGEGDVDWPEVRRALKEIGFSGWATAEVAGGDRDRIAEIGERIGRHLLEG